MSEEKILTNAPGKDYFYANTFATSPQMEAFLFFMASVVFVTHRMTFLSSHFSLYCSRLPHTCGPFYSPQMVKKLK